MVDYTGLENRRAARLRGFESLSFRKEDLDTKRRMNARDSILLFAYKEPCKDALARCRDDEEPATMNPSLSSQLLRWVLLSMLAVYASRYRFASECHPRHSSISLFFCCPKCPCQAVRMTRRQIVASLETSLLRQVNLRKKSFFAFLTRERPVYDAVFPQILAYVKKKL